MECEASGCCFRVTAGVGLNGPVQEAGPSLAAAPSLSVLLLSHPYQVIQSKLCLKQLGSDGSLPVASAASGADLTGLFCRAAGRVASPDESKSENTFSSQMNIFQVPAGCCCTSPVSCLNLTSSVTFFCDRKQGEDTEPNQYNQ